MNKIWIIGLGQFGLHAVRYLTKKNKDIEFVLVDPDETNLLQAEGPNRSLELADGTYFIAKNLHTSAIPDWIIPALPVHLAAEWCLTRLKAKGLRRILLPAQIRPLLPNSMEGPLGDIYVSHADFQCPGNCSESDNICTATRKSRKRSMFKILADVRMPEFQSLVIRSHQLGPGIGGYRPGMLFELLERVKQARGNILISTACRCHGVITATTQMQ